MRTKFKKTEYYSLGILIILLIAVYGRVVTHDFINYDDDKYILENPFVRGGLSWDSVRWAFTTGYEANWHPVTWLSHMLDVSLFGLNSGLHHAVNLLFHLANTLLLLLLLYRMTRTYWPSFMVAALFALHPLHVESVAWVAERKDLLSTFFLFLTLIAYHTYTIKTGYRNYLTVLLFYIAGLMSKPMLVTLPLVLAIIDYWPLARYTSRSSRLPYLLLIEKIPFVILAIGSAVVTCVVQQSWGATMPLGQQDIWHNLGNAVTGYVQYLFLMFLPFKLAVFYPYDIHSAWWKPVCSIAIILCICGVTALNFRRRPYLSAGWLWYITTLLPVIGIVNIGYHDYADRYTYIPLTGIFIALVWLSADIFNKNSANIQGAWAGGLIIVFLSIVTWYQVRQWKNSDTLFRHAAAVTSDNWIAHQHLSVTLLKQWRIPEAYDQIQQAIRIKPDTAGNYFILADIYKAMRKPEAAIKTLEKAVHLNPNSARGLQNLGVLYADAGRINDAESVLEQLGRVNPGYAEELKKYVHYIRSMGHPIPN